MQLYHKTTIYRDLKPQNILIRNLSSFIVVLSDFGLARVDVKESDITSCTTGAGTKAYMAPEGFTSGPKGHAMDMFSYGLVLVEVSTGNRIPMVKFFVKILGMEKYFYNIKKS